MSNKSDDKLISELFRRYRQTMLKNALRILGSRPEAEDAVQDAFLHIMNDPEKILLLPREQQPFYLVSVIENVCYNSLKKKNRHPTEDIDKYYELASNYSVEKKADEKILLDEVKSALKLLSERDYGIMYLLYFEGMRPAEIAKALDISEKNIYKYIDRAKKRLKNILNERGIHYDL